MPKDSKDSLGWEEYLPSAHTGAIAAARGTSSPRDIAQEAIAHAKAMYDAMEPVRKAKSKAALKNIQDQIVRDHARFLRNIASPSEMGRHPRPRPSRDPVQEMIPDEDD